MSASDLSAFSNSSGRLPGTASSDLFSLARAWRGMVKLILESPLGLVLSEAP